MRKNILIVLLLANWLLSVFVLGRETIFWYSRVEAPDTPLYCPTCQTTLTLYEARLTGKGHG